MHRMAAAMCGLIPRRLAAAAWKYRTTTTGHFRAKASLTGGSRPPEWTKTSDGNDAAKASVQEQGQGEKADPGSPVSSTPDSERHKGPEFSRKLQDLRNWKLFKNEEQEPGEKADPGSAVSRTLDSERHKGPEETKFSWKLGDLLNEEFFKKEVKMIPTTFTSVEGYMGSFIAPLLEEARADLCSALKSIRHAPVAEVIRIEGSGAGHSSDQSNLRIWFKEPRPLGCYAPKDEDILVLTNRKPRDYKDLEPFIIAVVPRDNCEDTPEIKDAEGTTSSSQDQDNVTSSEDKATANTAFQAEATTTVSVRVLSGKLPFEEFGGREVIVLPLVAVFLINMTSNNRIHDALKLPAGRYRRWDASLVEKIAMYTPVSQEVNSLLPVVPLQLPDKALDGLEKFNLNTSQQKAVLDCVSAMDQDNCWVRLIWGPPGTGKTKTIVSLLWSMLMKNHRTLTCAPTNTAVVEVASRLLDLLEDDFYGGDGRLFSLGDVVLYGSRINVDVNLSKIFLERRVSRLQNANWRLCLNRMLELLRKPLAMHSSYLKNVKSVHTGDILQQDGVGDDELQRRRKMTFRDFFVQNYEPLEEALCSCFENLRKDLPGSYTTAVDKVLQSVKAFGKLFRSEPERPLRKLFKSGGWPEFQNARALCLNKLEHFPDQCDLPNTPEKIEEFRVNGARIVLCTACSSFSLRRVRNAQRFDLLVVDEAAQLKECESLIPLQLGIRRTVLIGDEFQLPALVKSKLSGNAHFGRSLFERLSMLGHPKQARR